MKASFESVSVPLTTLLQIQPLRFQHSAPDLHLLLYPLNLLRWTEAVLSNLAQLQAMASVDSFSATVPYRESPCMLWQAHIESAGLLRIEPRWRIFGSMAQLAPRGSDQPKSMLQTLANVVKQILQGDACPLLGMPRASGVPVRQPASQKMATLLQQLPDKLRLATWHVSIPNDEHRTSEPPGNVQELRQELINAQRDPSCAPLHDGLPEFFIDAHRLCCNQVADLEC